MKPPATRHSFCRPRRNVFKRKFRLRVVAQAARVVEQAPRPGYEVEHSYRDYAVRQRLGSEGLQALLDAYRAGDSAKSIATRFEISRQSVNFLAAEAGLPRRLPRLTEEVEQQILELRASGLGQRAISLKMGMAKSTVQSVLARHGVSGPGKFTQKDEG